MSEWLLGLHALIEEPAASARVNVETTPEKPRAPTRPVFLTAANPPVNRRELLSRGNRRWNDRAATTSTAAAPTRSPTAPMLETDRPGTSRNLAGRAAPGPVGRVLWQHHGATIRPGRLDGVRPEGGLEVRLRELWIDLGLEQLPTGLRLRRLRREVDQLVSLPRHPPTGTTSRNSSTRVIPDREVDNRGR